MFWTGKISKLRAMKRHEIPAARPRVILAVISDLATDQRVHRVASALTEFGCNVRVIGRLKRDSLPLPETSYERSRLHMRFGRGKLMYAEFNLRLLFALLRQRCDILTANDLDTLLPCFIVSRLRRARLVYDSHELFAEVPELIGRPLTRKLWLMMEGTLFPRLKHVSVVSESIAKHYFRQYGVRSAVVRNLPAPINAPPVRHEIVQRERVLLYQGALNIGRGIELMIDAMSLLPEWTLWIVGEGDIAEELKRRTEGSPARARIRFWGRVAPAALGEITRQARIGLSLEEDKGLNYRYALPNKVFDCIQSRVPVIVANLPEMSTLIQKTGVGLILRKRTPDALATLVHLLDSSPSAYWHWVEACDHAAQDLHWNAERLILKPLYGL